MSKKDESIQLTPANSGSQEPDINRMITDINSAKAALPVEYVPVDDDFLTEYAHPLAVMKEHYKATGGLEILAIDEYSIICRVPTKQTLTDLTKNTKNMAPLDADIFFVVQCLIYPSGSTLRKWIDSGAPGLASGFAKSLMESAKLTVEATRKKL